MNAMGLVFSGFVICSFFLWVFERRRATLNVQFYLTLLTWCVFLYEVFRLEYPLLTVPQPYRHYQYQAENLLIGIYGWEVIQYVVLRIRARLLLSFD